MNTTLEASAISELFNAVDHQLTVKYMDVAGYTALVFDYILTLDLEVSLIWPSPWNMTKIFYLLTRYLPVLDLVNVIYRTPGIGVAPEACLRSVWITAWLYMVGIGISEIVLTFRTWAVWGRDSKLTVGLPILFVAVGVPMCVCTWLFLRALRFSPPPFAQIGCFATASNRTLFATWALLMVYEAVLTILMTIRGLNVYRMGGNSALFNVVYRDGILYYIYLFFLSTVNVIVINVFGTDYVLLLSSAERVLHAILAGRVILHIREQAKRNPLDPDTLTWASRDHGERNYPFNLAVRFRPSGTDPEPQIELVSDELLQFK